MSTDTVRIALVTDAEGRWCAHGAWNLSDEEAMQVALEMQDYAEGGEARHVIIATIPRPTVLGDAIFPDRIEEQTP